MTNMEYDRTQIEIILFKTEDVITTSSSNPYDLPIIEDDE